MGRPFHIHNLEDYWLWIETVLLSSGGYFEHEPSLIIQKMLDDPYDEWVGITVPQQRLLFNDGTFLEFDLVVDTDIALVEYSFHFQDGPMGSMIWRKDLHDGHERELGTKAHIHFNPADPNDRLPFDVVEVDEVIEQIFRYQDSGWRP
jgi:hypothetical protein